MQAQTLSEEQPKKAYHLCKKPFCTAPVLREGEECPAHQARFDDRVILNHRHF